MQKKIGKLFTNYLQKSGIKWQKKKKTDEENMAKIVNQAYKMDGNASKNLLKRFLRK